MQLADDRPVFHKGRHTVYIDSCEPQIRAAAAGKIDLVALSHGNYPGEIIDAGTLPGLSSIGYMNIVGAQDWGIENHCNEGVEFCFLETGSMFRIPYLKENSTVPFPFSSGIIH